MKRLAIALGLVGLAAVIVLIARAGWQSVLAALATAGWPLLWLVPLRLVPVALDALGWRLLLEPRDPRGRAGWLVLTAVAAVREAVNRLLPVAGVGGELVGIRLVSRRGVEAGAVAASVVTEVVLTLVSLVVFAALGLLLLAGLEQGAASQEVTPTALLIALPVPLICLWLISQGRLVGWLERLAARMTGAGRERPAWLASIPVFEAELSGQVARRGRLLGAALLQVAGMIAGAAEVWFVLRLLGHPVDVVSAVIIESVVLFVRNLAFAVPAGLGAQEAGVVLICAALGLDQQLALGLALAKRMREVLFGLPALVGWHLWEARSSLLADAGAAEDGGKPI